MSAKEFWEKHKTFVFYNIFGFTATLLETFLYWLFYVRLGIENVMATLFAWTITVIYAFFTNKILVYKSRDWNLVIIVKEFLYFFGFRAITGIFNIIYMYVTVDLLHWWPVTMKAIAALIVGLSNYMIGKKLIFKHRKRMDEIAKDIEKEYEERKTERKGEKKK